MSRQDDIIDRLIQVALDVLHHDTDHGDAVDKYEREVLRKKFAEILGRPALAVSSHHYSAPATGE